MKCMAYFFLFGLLSSPVWGQSVPQRQPVVMRSCVGLSCSASSTYVFRNVNVGTFRSYQATAPSFKRSAHHEVLLGTFRSFPTTIPPVMLSKTSQKGEPKIPRQSL